MRGLNDQTIVVTGAGGGIGTAICQRLLAEGANVIGTDIDDEALATASAKFSGSSGTWTSVTLDITNFDQVNTCISELVKHGNTISTLINNAGWDIAKPFIETGPDFWDKVIDINLRGPLNMHRVVLPYMAQAKGGKIVNISSDAARVGSSGEAVYAACKGGIVSLTKTLAREHARDNICLNAVCPGPTETNLLRNVFADSEYGDKMYEGLKRAIPLKRLGQPEDIPGIVAFLASADANYITGQVISVSGGLTMHG